MSLLICPTHFGSRRSASKYLDTVALRCPRLLVMSHEAANCAATVSLEEVEDMMAVLESWMPTARKHSHLRSVLVEIERLWVDCSVLLVRLQTAMDGDPEFVVTSETEVLSKQILLKHSVLIAIMNRVMGESQPKSLKRKASGLCDDEGADDDGGAQSSMQA